MSSSIVKLCEPYEFRFIMWKPRKYFNFLRQIDIARIFGYIFIIFFCHKRVQSFCPHTVFEGAGLPLPSPAEGRTGRLQPGTVRAAGEPGAASG